MTWRHNRLAFEKQETVSKSMSHSKSLQKEAREFDVGRQLKC